jgi:hypothetical protein
VINLQMEGSSGSSGPGGSEYTCMMGGGRDADKL